MTTPGTSDSASLKKSKKTHPGKALGIRPPRNDRFMKGTKRYGKGELDLDSIIAFVSLLKETGTMPKELMRLRGCLRDAFPGFGANKNLIRAAYEKAGWDISELSNVTKRQKKEARQRELQKRSDESQQVDED